MICPCINCDKRTPTCHNNECSMWIKWKEFDKQRAKREKAMRNGTYRNPDVRRRIEDGDS